MLAIILYSIFCLNRNFISRRGAKLLRGNPHPTHVGTVTGALNYQQPISNFSLFAVICWLNPRTYAQSYPHRGTMGREGGGVVGVAGPSSPYFDFAFSGKAFDLLYNTKYILCVVAMLEACDVTKHSCHLVFFQELEIWKKQYN